MPAPTVKSKVTLDGIVIVPIRHRVLGNTILAWDAVPMPVNKACRAAVSLVPSHFRLEIPLLVATYPKAVPAPPVEAKLLIAVQLAFTPPFGCVSQGKEPCTGMLR